MDKTAQAARQARLAQALRTNLRRRKAGDAPKPAGHDPADAEDGGQTDAASDAATDPASDASPDSSKPEPGASF
jgi:hypothetical protein